jgi:DNA-binding XRE family transcriptional regulator
MKKRTKQQLAARLDLAALFVSFRERHLLSQVKLAELLGVGRRTIQYAESGKSHRPEWPCNPSRETMTKFYALKSKYEPEG